MTFRMRNEFPLSVVLSRVVWALVLACAFAPALQAQPDFAVEIEEHSGETARRLAYAQARLIDVISEKAAGAVYMTAPPDKASARLIRLKVDAGAFAGKADKPAEEAYRIEFLPGGNVEIVGADSRGVIWGTQDFIHYHLADWQAGKPTSSEPIESRPELKIRGFWTWQHGCYDPFAYIDRASEWKLNTVCFWNRGVPMNAERLATYAAERGVDIMWGFGWAWTWPDLTDASPALAERLMELYERQKEKVDPKLGSLCPSQPETPAAIRDLVLDVYENQYRWVPGRKMIYFQTVTETLCSCADCKAQQPGEAVLHAVLPAIEALHAKYPEVYISWGVHNTGSAGDFQALSKLPSYVTLCWEKGMYWADSIEQFQEQASLRGVEEKVTGIVRVTMNGGLVFQSELIGNEKERVWPNRIEQLWDYLEEGQPESLGARNFEVDGKSVGYPCSSDWRPVDGALLKNQNMQHLVSWSQAMANAPVQEDGILLLVEAGLIELKMRRMPAMAAEVLWNPNLAAEQLEPKLQRIWNQQVGGWPQVVNPFWNERQAPTSINQTPGDITGGHGLGAAYDTMQQ